MKATGDRLVNDDIVFDNTFSKTYTFDFFYIFFGDRRLCTNYLEYMSTANAALLVVADNDIRYSIEVKSKYI